MEQKKIDRINELAKKSKLQELSEQEKTEQAQLRKEFIESYKKSLINQLENTVIQYPDGTKKKVERKK